MLYLYTVPRSGPTPRRPRWGSWYGEEASGTWAPSADVLETPHTYQVAVEVPGVDPESLDVSLQANTLTIRGERPRPALEQGASRLLAERRAGAFERVIELPAHVVTDTVEAVAQDGVLTVRVLKSEEARSHRVEIVSR